MKRLGNLYEKIYELENLNLAEKNARKGKSRQKQVKNFSKSRELNILSIHEVLKNEEYKVSKYSTFTIFDKKFRDIYVLPYKDRIIQHAILQVIKPIFDKSFISQTYSCIKNKGIHKALKQLKHYLKDKSNKYCLFLDIKKYYPNINKTTLKLFFRRKFKDRKLLNLLDSVIDSHSKGIPIGSYLSQYFGNFYLTYFDHFLKEVKKVKYLRYMDNICILHSDKEYLHTLKREIESYLYNILDLELSTSQIFPINSRGIDFVGYVNYSSHILIRKSIKQNFIKMLKSNPNQESINSYLGWFKHANCVNLTNKYLNNDKTIRHNIRRSY